MVQIIAGEKGKGKTKELLRMVNEEIFKTNGNIVYLDRTNRHMYELSNRIRLINVTDYLTIGSTDEFIGFLSGIISQDNDLEKVYIDSLSEMIETDETGLYSLLDNLENVSRLFSVDIFACLTLNEQKIPDSFKKSVICTL